MIDWTLPYSSEWRLYRVEESTWADGGIAGRLVSASVERDSSGEAPELESGEIEVLGGFEPGYMRLVLVATQGGTAERADIATLLFEKAEEGLTSTRAVGSSVLHPAATECILAGEFVPKGADGAEEAARLLRKSVRAPVDTAGSFVLNDDYVFTPGQSVLECVWALLGAGGFCIQIEGDGTALITPVPSEPSASIPDAGMLSSKPSASDRSIDAPNRFTAVLEGASATAANASDGPSSYVERGYWVDERDESPALVNGESLQGYAERRLRELSVSKRSFSYSRAWMPGVLPFTLLSVSEAAFGASALRVERQSLAIGNGISVSEDSVEEVPTWTE